MAQLIDSDRRNRYLHSVRTGVPSERVLDPMSTAFDPQRGAILRAGAGNFDDACWLVFLSVHFGRHRRHMWKLTANFYGKLGQGGMWDWQSARDDVNGLRVWLDENIFQLKQNGVAFGNHRKYESLNGTGPNGTGATIESYVDWVGESHHGRLSPPEYEIVSAATKFSMLYASLDNVVRFGRTAKFDYLASLGKLGLANIDPDSAHLSGSTGPLAGARLLFDGSRTSIARASDLESRLARLQEWLALPFDTIEDALCNWQKNPSRYVGFRG